MVESSWVKVKVSFSASSLSSCSSSSSSSSFKRTDSNQVAGVERKLGSLAAELGCMAVIVMCGGGGSEVEQSRAEQSLCSLLMD